MPTFDIILTTFNRLDYTRRTVGSLIKSGAYDACDRFIIVDNHSLDEGMNSFLQDMTLYQKTFVIRRPTNDGWATAVNDALGLSRAEYLFLINNDVEFEPDFHKEMLEVMKHNPVSLLGGWRHTAHSVTGEHETFDEMTDVPAVCWLLSKRAMEKAGMLEERGPCLTKGGNGEDSAYVNMMRKWGLVGATKIDVAHHIDGY